jgi:hypothetical protein
MLCLTVADLKMQEDEKCICLVSHTALCWIHYQQLFNFVHG